MKLQAIEIARAQSDPAAKLNLAREYIQACVLRSLHESEAFTEISFVGGTALRFLYNLPRFSEDLDFSLHEPGTCPLEKWLKKIKSDLTYQKFNPSIKLKEKSNVHAAWIRFEDILQELELAVHPKQKFSIKIEIDYNPPLAAVLEKKVINRPFLFGISHHSLESLFAGKLHALITRKYTKGRDWYDLIWYLSRNKDLSPSLEFLQNALNQTGYNEINAENWKEEVLQRAGDINWKTVVADVKPFLEIPGEAELLNLENVTAILQ